MFCRFTKRSAEGQSEGITQTEGSLQDKKVVQAANQTNKVWFITAIGVGAVIVVGMGGFGALGLAHSYDLISLPSWLTPAINAIGQTPHFWSLWTMTAGGLVVGGTLITYGAVKMHQPRKAEQVRDQSLEERAALRKELLADLKLECEADWHDDGDEEYYRTGCEMLAPDQFTLERSSKKPVDENYYIILRTKNPNSGIDALYSSSYMDSESCNALVGRLALAGFTVSPPVGRQIVNPVEMLGDHFLAAGIDRSVYSGIPENTYSYEIYGNNPFAQYVVILKNDAGHLLCTEKMDEPTYEMLQRALASMTPPIPCNNTLFDDEIH